MKYYIIAKHQQKYPTKLMCSVLEVTARGYYAWRMRGPSRRKLQDEHLAERIESIRPGPIVGSMAAHASMQS